MLTRIAVSAAFVALLSVPAAMAGENCNWGHKTKAQTAQTQTPEPQTTAPVTVAEAPADTQTPAPTTDTAVQD